MTVHLVLLTFYLKQRSLMYFYLRSRFAPQFGEHHQNSNAFLVCKNENETSKKNTGNQK